MSVRILPLMRPVPKHAIGAPYCAWKKLTFAQVPQVGEFVNLGNDEHGYSADYQAEIVHHLPLRPGGTDAEVYMRRAYLVDVKMADGKAPVADDFSHWSEGAWPVGDDGTDDDGEEDGDTDPRDVS